MWLLKDRNGKIKYLKPNKIINIGRKQVDIVLENDSSISRAHATITVTLKDQMRTSEASSTCIVKDANSKYGTAIIRNGIEMKVSSEGLEVQPLDTLKFGLQQHTFKVEYIHFVTMISRLSVDDKTKLQDIMDSIGGVVIDYPDDNCTHLTATTATSTNKIISAMIAGIPIVGINYWIAVLNAIESDENLPDSDSFILPLKDKGVNAQRASLKPNPMRKTLFQGKNFIFFSAKTFKEYKKMIKDAGGKTELYTINEGSISEYIFRENNIIMQITDDSISDEIAIFNTMLYEKMQAKKLRMISETEIPLAIAYVSLEQFCNPKYNFKELIRRKSRKQDTSEVLALDTQDILMTTNNVTASTSNHVYIPETDDFAFENTLENQKSFQEKVHRVFESKNTFITKENASSLKKNIGTKESSTEPSKTHVNNLKADGGTTTTAENKVLCQPSSSKEKEMSISTKDNRMDYTKEVQNVEHLSKESKMKDQKDENSKQKKKQGENLGSSESRQSEQGGWKRKEQISFAEGNKRKRTSEDFTELEKQKKEMNKTKEVKTNKWGFKKSERKVTDFDLDDMDMDEIDEALKKDTSALTSQNKDKSNNSKNVRQQNTNLFESKTNDESYSNIPMKSLQNDNTKICKENISNWTKATLPKKPETEDIFDNDMGMKASSKLALAKNIKLEPKRVIRSGKTFNKVYPQIPVKRIVLSDMTVWKPKT